MEENKINIPRESTLRELVEIRRKEVERNVDAQYKSLVAGCQTKEEVDDLFIEWWKYNYDSNACTKSEMLERWFGRVLDDNKIHGVVFPLYSTSQTAIGEYTDDSVGLTCTPSTAETLGQDDFAALPQFWCIEVSAEKNEDGSHEIFYVEHIDDIKDVRSGEHLCWVLQKNTYTKEWDKDGYRYLKMRCHQEAGYQRWQEGTDRTGKVYEYIAHAKYYAGYDSAGKITCGTGLAPINFTSHTTGVARWRARGKQYSGASGNLIKFLDRMMRLKYAKKGNSGTIEGCSSYNYQYTAAKSEEGVKRVILTKEQAKNLFVESSVQIGDNSSSDRNAAKSYSICKNKLISSIQDVEIEGETYSAVYIDSEETFDTTEGSTYLSTDPYWSGWNDEVLGTDGSRYNYVNGKEPGLLQRIEFMNGSYMIVGDELLQWSNDENGDYNFDIYTCHDQTKVTTNGTISSDYTKQEGLTLVIPAGTKNEWKYIEDTAISKAVEYPKGVNASGSGVGCKAGFYCSPAASGVRASWCFGSLSAGGFAGVACRNSSYSAGFASWSGSVGSPGLAG